MAEPKKYHRNGFLTLKKPQNKNFHTILQSLDIKLSHICILDRGPLEFFQYGYIHKITTEMDSSHPKTHQRVFSYDSTTIRS